MEVKTVTDERLNQSAYLIDPVAAETGSSSASAIATSA
jgi:hypothetical protein